MFYVIKEKKRKNKNKLKKMRLFFPIFHMGWDMDRLASSQIHRIGTPDMGVVPDQSLGDVSSCTKVPPCRTRRLCPTCWIDQRFPHQSGTGNRCAHMFPTDESSSRHLHLDSAAPHNVGRTRVSSGWYQQRDTGGCEKHHSVS